MSSVQPSEAVSISRFQPRAWQPSGGESQSAARLAEVIPPLDQSAGISGPAGVSDRHMHEALAGLLHAEALQRHREWLPGLLAEARRRAPTFQEYFHRFERDLLGSLREEPVEDGVTHPGEAVLQRAVRDFAVEVRAWLNERMASKSAAERGALLRLVGRLPPHQVLPWGYPLVADALKDEELEVRDAAIKALELWRGLDALHVLEDHFESEPWLADHLGRLVEELRREA